MPQISKKMLDDIRFRNDIVELIGSYLNVQRAGSSFKALCPFHKEKTPSFHINPQRQIFHCFGCGAGGDVFGFIMQHEGVDFIGAVKLLAQRAGITLELDDADKSGADKALLYKILSEVALRYHKTLLESPEAGAARQYLQQRDLTGDTAEEFQIGFAPDRWSTIVEWAQKKQYPLEQVEQAGLIVRNTGQNTGSEFYDRFRNRLMFPIHDEQARVIGFSGRIMDDKDKTAKYVNSPEGPLFHKGRILYALDKARRHIVESREAVLCEGQIDVIRCHQAGLKTAVASQGTAFTEDHIRIIRRYADSVVVIFDPDRAGQDSAIRTAGLFLMAGLAVRVAALPKNEDPDSFIRKNGIEAFRRIMEKAGSAIGFQVDILSARENMGSEIGTMRVAKAVLQTISQSPNAVQRSRLTQEAAQRLGIPPSALMDDLNHLLRQAPRSSAPEQTNIKPITGPSLQPREELELCEHLARIMDFPELGDLVQKYLPLDMISDPLCRLAIEAALKSGKSGNTFEDSLLNSGAAPTDELQKFAARIMMAPAKVRGNDRSPQDAVKDQILYMWRKKLERERAEIEKRAGSTPTPEDEDRRRQITFDLRSLKSWEDGSTIIEIEMTN